MCIRLIAQESEDGNENEIEIELSSKRRLWLNLLMRCVML